MKITISDIPNYYPSEEQLYIDSSKFRIIQDGNDLVIFNTPIKHKVLNDETWRIRKVQSVLYNKYNLSFIVTESQNVDILSLAGTITITLDSGEIHNAELLDVPSYENLQNSNFRRVSLSYRDLNSKETLNHLDVGATAAYASRFEVRDVTQLPQISRIFDIKSNILCRVDFSEFNRTTINDNYIESVSSESGFYEYKFFAYISESDLQSLKANLTGKHVKDEAIVLTYDTQEIKPLEIPTLEVLEDDFEDLKGVIITIKYSQILNYPYE
jgi:hypothetical protein